MAHADNRWPVSADANLTVATQGLRQLIGMFVEVSHASVRIFLTDDGTGTGTDLFSTGDCPHAQVMIQPAGQDREWSQGWRAGPLLRPEHASAIVSFGWEVDRYAPGKWTVRIFRKGNPDDATGGDEEGDRGFLALVLVCGRP
jgi:hypothetical protein